MASDNKEKNKKIHIEIILLLVMIVIILIFSSMRNIAKVKEAINYEPNAVGFKIKKIDSDSLGNKKEIKVDDDGKIIEEDVYVDAIPIIKLNNNNWEILRAQLSGYETDSRGNMIFPDGYVIYCNRKYVNNIVFDTSYKGKVLGGLQVGEDFEKIKETLGVPSFKTDDYIGYKTKTNYVFFYQDAISVYSNRRMIDNNKLEELFLSYFEKTYGKERKMFLAEIRNNYQDFEVEMDEETNTVTIKSVARQVVAKLDSLGNIEIEFYNGYDIALDKTKDYVEKRIYKTNEEDYVEIRENERISVNR